LSMSEIAEALTSQSMFGTTEVEAAAGAAARKTSEEAASRAPSIPVSTPPISFLVADSVMGFPQSRSCYSRRPGIRLETSCAGGADLSQPVTTDRPPALSYRSTYRSTYRRTHDTLPRWLPVTSRCTAQAGAATAN